MSKQELLKEIAVNGYNIGFGAKKHFASYDLIIKLPYWISFIVLSIGIIQLAYQDLPFQKEISILLIIISIASLFLNFYEGTKEEYKDIGAELTQHFNRLRQLYFQVKDSEPNDYELEKKEMNMILEQFYKKSITKQVFLSQWYAHFKFFYEMQIDWIDSEIKFQFWKDKVPNSLKFAVIILLIMTLLSTLIIIAPQIYEYFRHL